MKKKIKEMGDFNAWKGNICIYFTQKDVKVIAKELKITFSKAKVMGISEIYKMYC